MYLSQIESALKNKPQLQESISQLITYIIDKKKFKFDKSEFQFDISELEKNEILVYDDRKFQVAKNNMFYFLFFLHYKNNLSFTLSDDIDAAIEFVETVDEHFNVERTVLNGRTEFFKNFRAFILIAINREFNSDFISYVLSLNHDSKNIYKFNSAFCDSLTDLYLLPKIVFTILSHLYSEINTEAMMNLNTGEITNSLRKYASFDTAKGRELLEISGKEDLYQPNLTIGTIAGIYDTDREKFRNELNALIKEDKYHESIIIALSRVKLLSIEESNKNFDLIQSIHPVNETTFYSLSRFYSGTLENVGIVDDILIQKCFNKLHELIIHPNQNIRGSVLHEIRFLKGYDKEISELLVVLLVTTDYDTKFDKAISDVFFQRNEVIFFSGFLIQYARKFKLSIDIKKFDSAIDHFQDKEPDFSRELINLLIHDEGEVRFIANRILTTLSSLQYIYKFKFDILTLPAIEQYKLWVSVMDDFREPKYSLPLLLPLINSKHEVVQEAFICKLEELTESYFSSVIKEMKNELDLTSPHNQNIINRVQAYLDKFCIEIDKKRGIKELDPYYTQSKLINSFHKKFSSKWNEQTDKTVNENSIFSMLATTVILAKGGGWKHEKHSEVSQLTQFSTSFSLPRESFIEGEFFDWYFRNKFIENWIEKFKQWEATISS